MINSDLSKWTKLGNCTAVSDTTGTKITSSSSFGNFISNKSFSGDICFEYELVDWSGYADEAYIYNSGSLNNGYRTDTGTGGSGGFFGPNESGLNSYSRSSPKTGDIIKLKRIGTSFKYYVNDVLISTCSSSIPSTGYCGFFTYSNRYQKVKNVKVYNI